MARVIQIQITGEAGQYEATVQRIIEKNNQLNRSAIQGAQQTEAALGNVQRILVNFPSFFGGIASGIAAAFSVGAIVAFGKSLLEAAGQIDDLSKRTGFSRQTLSGLKSTIEENGGSLEAFATAISRAQKSLADIEGDGKKAAQALKFMGLDVNDLVKSTPEVFFEKFAAALSKVEGQNQRAAIATRVMGREGAAQIPVILELADKFQTLAERGVSDANIKQLDKFGDALTRLKNGAIGLAQEGLANLIRGFDRLFKISDLEKAQADVAKFADEMQTLDKRIAATKTASPATFGLFSSDTDREARRQQQLIDLQEKRTKASLAFNDVQDKLIRLQQKEQDKPPVPGGGLGGDPEAAQKLADRAAEAVAKLQAEQLKLNVTNLEAARTNGRLTDALLAQGLTIGDLDGEIRKASLALIDQEKQAALDAAAHDKILTPALKAAIEQQAKSKIATFDAAEAALKHKEYLELEKRALAGDEEAQKQLAAVLEASGKNREILNQRTLDSIELERQLGDLESDRIGILGRTGEAERLRLENQIKYLDALKKEEILQGKDTEQLRNAQIVNTQTKLQQLGVASVNIGQQISSTVSDIFTAAIQGTLKFADIGKSLLAGVARTAGDFLTQILNKKLGFENILLTNMQGLPGQMNNAFAQGVQSVGGWLLNLFFGGSGGGSIPIPGGSGGSVGGPVGGGGGAGGLSSSTLASTVSTASSTITTSLGTSIAGVLTTVALAFAKIPIIGWIIAAVIMLFRIIANQQERPNAKFSGNFQGVSFDPTMAQFVPGDINVQIGRKSGIKNSQAGQIADNLQKRLVIMSQQWVDILNIFPDFIANDIQPALDETNSRLNKNFANLKFSPGGSRSIQQELEAMSGPDGLVRFFDAFLPSLAHGFSSTLEHAGITGTDFTGFGGISPGFKFPQKDWDDFIKAIKDVAGLTSQLGSVGAGKFLTTSDISAAGSLFNQLFSVTDAATFTKAAAEIQDKLKPVTDFLQQSVQEASDLFGRGLIAAMQAVTASDANAAFLKNIGEGVRDKIFSGISQAFIASAQFSDLLAPIQQIIRQFTQDALTSGQVPDVGAFRQALLPAIEDISTRAQTLAPLIQALQSLGFDVTQALQSLIGTVADTAAAAATASPSVTINIENFNRDDDPQSLARQIQDLLNGRTAP